MNFHKDWPNFDKCRSNQWHDASFVSWTYNTMIECCSHSVSVALSFEGVSMNSSNSFMINAFPRLDVTLEDHQLKCISPVFIQKCS